MENCVGASDIVGDGDRVHSEPRQISMKEHLGENG